MSSLQEEPLYVNYILTDYNTILQILDPDPDSSKPEIPEGSIITLTDSEGFYYYYGGKLRSAGGIRVVDQLPVGEGSPDVVYVVKSGESKGIYVWDIDEVGSNSGSCINIVSDKHTSNLFVTDSSDSNNPDSIKNKEADNGNVYMNIVYDGELQNSHKIEGTGAVTVESDKDGNIKIYVEEIKQNSKDNYGYVPKGNDHPNKVWGTDNEGNPSWRPSKDYIVLDDSRDLDGVKEPGYYVSRPNNNIQNKPEGVSSFGLDVIKTSNTVNCIKQVIHPSGEVKQRNEALTHLEEIRIDSGYLIIKMTEGDYSKDVDTFSTASEMGDRVYEYNFLDTILLTYLDDTKTFIITLREAVNGNIMAWRSDGNYLYIPIDESISYRWYRVIVEPDTEFPSWGYTNLEKDKLYYLPDDFTYGYRTPDQTEWNIYYTSEIEYFWANISCDVSSYSNKYYWSQQLCYNIVSNKFYIDNIIGSKETGVKLTEFTNPTVISINRVINDEQNPIAFVNENKDTIILYLSALNLPVNEIYIEHDRGCTWLFIRNIYGQNMYPPNTVDTTDELYRNCINDTWTNWSKLHPAGSNSEWSEFVPDDDSFDWSGVVDAGETE